MKNLHVIVLLVLIALSTVFPQGEALTTSSQLSFSQSYQIDETSKLLGSVVIFKYAVDSLTTTTAKSVLSDVIYAREFDGINLQTNPWVWRMKNTSNDKANVCLDVKVYGCFETKTDTVCLDTIALSTITESDTLGVLTLNGENTYPIKVAPFGYRIKVQPVFTGSNFGDCDSGVITLFMPLPEHDGIIRKNK